MVLARPDERETRPYHCSLRLSTMVRRSSCGPIDCWILARTCNDCQHEYTLFLPLSYESISSAWKRCVSGSSDGKNGELGKQEGRIPFTRCGILLPHEAKKKKGKKKEEKLRASAVRSTHIFFEFDFCRHRCRCCAAAAPLLHRVYGKVWLNGYSR